jgi:hypothetical protein
VIERLLGEAHRLLLAAGAALDLRRELALEEEAREALADLGELALERQRQLVAAEEPGQKQREALDELRLEHGAVRRRRDAVRLLRGVLQELKLGHDLRGDGIELAVGLELGPTVDDLRRELLIA